MMLLLLVVAGWVDLLVFGVVAGESGRFCYTSSNVGFLFLFIERLIGL
jgi:hypothetical protein